MAISLGLDAFFADLPRSDGAPAVAASKTRGIDPLLTPATGASLLNTTIVGGKAASWLRLRDAGLPTPPGFVITHALFAALTSVPAGGPTSTAAIADTLRAIDSRPFPEGF